MANVRLLIDEDISKGPLLAATLRQRGFDAVTVQEVDKMGMADEDLLAYAASEGRTLLTFNIKDFAPYARRWQEAGKTHAGVVVSPHLTGRQFGELLRCTLNLLNTVEAEAMRDTVRYLQEFRRSG